MDVQIHRVPLSTENAAGLPPESSDVLVRNLSEQPFVGILAVDHGHCTAIGKGFQSVGVLWTGKLVVVR
jgi:hypothetical protein